MPASPFFPFFFPQKASAMRAVLLVWLFLAPSAWAITTTFTGQSLDVEIYDTLGVALFAASVNPHTNERVRAEQFSMSFQIDRMGMWPDRPTKINRPDESIWPSIFNISLNDLPRDVSLYPVISAEGKELQARKASLTIPVQSKLSSVNDTTIKFASSWIGAASTDTYIDFLGWKLPVARDALKITFEWNDLPLHYSNGTEFPDPHVYLQLHAEVTLRFNVSTFSSFDFSTYPIQNIEDIRMTQRVDPDAPFVDTGSFYNQILFQDHRGSLTMNFLKFSALNVSGTPVQSTGVFVPFPESSISQLAGQTVAAASEASAAGSPFAVLTARVGLIFAGKLSPSLPGTLVWDPDATLLFSGSSGEFSATESSTAIAAGVSVAAVVIVAAVAGIVGWRYKVTKERKMSQNIEKKLTQVHQVTQDDHQMEVARGTWNNGEVRATTLTNA